VSLFLDDNQFTGEIPASLGDLLGLSSLSLGSNQINGTIPASLGSLQNLHYLHLNDNQLSGEIPASLGSLATLRSLRLGLNQLTGDIPSSLGSLSELFNLDLSSNNLIGQIPSSFGSLSQIYTIDLSSNNLIGAILSSLGTLSRLSDLHLNNNNFTGSIPSTLIGQYLRILVLSNNSLSGPVPKVSSSIERCEVNDNADLCGQPKISSLCTVGLATCHMDCRMMHAWLPTMFDDKTCCSQSGIKCNNDRIVNLYVFFKSNSPLELWRLLDLMDRSQLRSEISSISHGLTSVTTTSPARYHCRLKSSPSSSVLISKTTC
jgi:hypothetical protein